MLRILYFYFKIFILLFVAALIAGIGMIYYYSRELPDYSQLANYYPPSVTRIYSADGKLIEEYALEHRIFVPITSIPNSLIEAFIAAEDRNFYHHPGFDITSIFRAAITNISGIIHQKRMKGGSTITQQVVKNFLLTSERSIERKIKEAILSYMISEVFTKQQIMELYLNQTFLGKGAYGVAIAAQNYFNKSVDELNLAESAFLAGLPKAPSNYDPDRNYKRAKERRDYVIARMYEDGYINAETAKEAIESPIVTHKRDRSETVKAEYYAEAVREKTIEMVGKETFYSGGLTIITSLDANLQNYTTNALRKGIRDYDQKKGYRGAIAHIKDVENWLDQLKKVSTPPSLHEYKVAAVLDVLDSHAKIGLLNGSTSKISLNDMKWAKVELRSAKNILKKGDVIVVEALKTDYALRQIPLVNGGAMVMNHATGQVLAAEGGYDFDNSRFNRVTQALRQPGSLIKTFVYLAALENGVQPSQIFEDAPITISQGAGMPLWKPKNYKGNFLGAITMRTGLEKSRNLITVRVAQAIGLSKVAEIIKRFGINQDPKKLYSMVLGSLETTLEKMATAYATLANYGIRVTPHFIEMIKDRNGKIIYKRDERFCKNCKVDDIELESDNTILETTHVPQRMITDEANSYQIISMLVGAAQRGTGATTNKLKKVIATKTGTTNDSKDTWIIGFTPTILVGAYIGYDMPKDMGKRATGSNVALPVLINFMESASTNIPSLEFKVPQTIRLLPVDPRTGKFSNDKGSIMEAFKVHNIAPNIVPKLNMETNIIRSDINNDIDIERELNDINNAPVDDIFEQTDSVRDRSDEVY